MGLGSSADIVTFWFLPLTRNRTLSVADKCTRYSLPTCAGTPVVRAVPWLRRLVVGLSPRRLGSVHVGFVVNNVALGQVFPRVLQLSRVNFILPMLNYLEKLKKTDLLSFHLHHRVAQKASRLRCVRSICCRAFHKKNSGY
jgi:hypothetical protein